VSGEGETEWRVREPEPWVEIRGWGGTCVVGGMFGWAWTPELRFAVLGRLLESGDLDCESVGDFPLLALEPGDLALFDVSFIQFLSDARWLMNGC
jgi:hypothetical protein